ncbi:skin secretory protein xP2-like [Falco rusticolus]|uniref:skin secretory protein xP2-like n=1 Tax=Falco rusticolus TaxID=120794 RepID=UPI0018869B1D|nr:skin secretory protein xP2-like [Falco rusticolus]
MRSRQPFSLALQNTSDAGPHAGGCEGGAAATRRSLSPTPHPRSPPHGARLAPSSPPHPAVPHPDPGSPIPGDSRPPLRTAAAACSTNSGPRVAASPRRVPAPASAPAPGPARARCSGTHPHTPSSCPAAAAATARCPPGCCRRSAAGDCLIPGSQQGRVSCQAPRSRACSRLTEGAAPLPRFPPPPRAGSVYRDGNREDEAAAAARASDPGSDRSALSDAGGSAGAFFLRHQLLPGGPGLQLRLGLGRGLRAPLRPVRGPDARGGGGAAAPRASSQGPGLGWGETAAARGGRRAGRWQRRGRPGRLERSALTALVKVLFQHHHSRTSEQEVKSTVSRAEQ